MAIARAKKITPNDPKTIIHILLHFGVIIY